MGLEGKLNLADASKKVREICEKYGYRLKNYGQTFERVYQKELASLARKLKDKNITVEEDVICPKS